MRAFYSAFLAIFSLCYVSLLALELPLLIYYPLEGVWSFTPLGEEYGPAMAWYGLVLGSLVAAFIGGIVAVLCGLPDRAGALAPVIAALAMVVCIILMQDFFLPGVG